MASGRTLPGLQSGAAAKVIGQYRVIREIGSGGMAVVYLAQQLNLRREVALKELRLADRMDAGFAHRFLREAQLAGSFSHPNIVTVHDYFEQQGVPYIAMEYLPAGSLRPYVGELTLPQTGGVLADALAALGQAERRGVVHRDIKPENLLVTSEGGIKITDFGVAKVTNALASQSMATGTGITVGTPNYLSPEQAMGRPVGPWTDIYSLGITAFELLVGRTPFGDTPEPMGIMLRHVNEDVPRVGDVRPAMHPWVSDWVAWMTAKSPDDRPRSAYQALAALDEVFVHLLGNRWRDEAPLTTAGGDSGASSDPSKGPALGVGGIPIPVAGARTPAPSPLGEMEVTEAPAVYSSSAAIGSPPRSSGAGLRRLSILAKVAVGLLVLVAGITLGFREHQPRAAQAPVASADRVISLPSPTRPLTSSVAPSVAVPTVGKDPAAASSDAWLKGQARDARGLAHNLDDEADRLAARRNGRSRSADIRSLRRGARLYRTAASAARRGDVAGYSEALNAAHSVIGVRVTAHTPRARQAPQTQDASPSESASPASDDSCAGDSTSDDPSDDECGE